MNAWMNFTLTALVSCIRRSSSTCRLMISLMFTLKFSRVYWRRVLSHTQCCSVWCWCQTPYTDGHWDAVCFALCLHPNFVMYAENHARNQQLLYSPPPNILLCCVGPFMGLTSTPCLSFTPPGGSSVSLSSPSRHRRGDHATNLNQRCSHQW